MGYRTVPGALLLLYCIDHSRDKSLFLPLDINEIGVKNSTTKSIAIDRL